MRTAAENLRGAAWMTLGMGGYVINDSFIKLAVEEMPLFQAIFLRGVAITALLAVVLNVRGDLAGAAAQLRGPVLVRIALETVGTVAYLLALTHVPLAGLTAVMQIVPIAVTFAAARLLREAVSWHRVSAVAAGFVGVVFVVRPGSDSFSPWFLLGFVAVTMIVGREIATRRINVAVPSLVVALGTAVAITTMGGLVSIVQGWDEIEGREIALLVGAAMFLTIGYVGSIVTIRVGEMSFTAPFRFTVLVFAIGLQIVLFDDVPDAMTFIGAAIITGAGLYAFARERAVLITVGPR